jgi:hypothetical protein
MKERFVLVIIFICLSKVCYSQNSVNELFVVDTVNHIKYRTIDNGDMIWMAENLKNTKYNDGSEIPKLSDSKLWSTATEGAYCFLNNDSINKNIYGILYNWYAVESGKICPSGWHVPPGSMWLVETSVPSGCRDETGKYLFVKRVSFYWTSSECTNTEAYHISVYWDGSQIKKDYAYKNYGFSVRCVLNNKR